jgi:sterol desaturase/sphingolipid hydroxylase (fatty acid hydroxylase superfamily)
MEAFIEAHEPVIRLACFGGVLALMALWELLAPRRPLAQSKIVRWSSNLGIVVVNTVVVRLLFPAAAMGVAVLAAERGWGLLNTVELTSGVAIVVSVVALDFAIYLQHVMFHAIPALWRLHRMHHADLDFDVTTGLRFHPIEIILSVLIKMAAIVVLGPPVVAVLIFEVTLNATSMFNHGNVRLPGAIDRPLRWLMVTPDMHRVHHSVVAAETNSNFGFSLPWWDRLLGTYRDQPAAGHDAMAIGIEMFRDGGALHLHRMLIQPFIGEAGAYPINRVAGPDGDEGK